MIITYLTFVLPFCVWTLRGFVLGVPKELEEAALVDGCTRFGAFVRILLPLVAPGPGRHVGLRLHPGLERVHLRLRPAQDADKQTLDGLARLVHHPARHRLGPLMAGATLTALPVVIFFLLVQRKIASG